MLSSVHTHIETEASRMTLVCKTCSAHKQEWALAFFSWGLVNCLYVSMFTTHLTTSKTLP